MTEEMLSRECREIAIERAMLCNRLGLKVAIEDDAVTVIWWTFEDIKDELERGGPPITSYLPARHQRKLPPPDRQAESSLSYACDQLRTAEDLLDRLSWFPHNDEERKTLARLIQDYQHSVLRSLASTLYYLTRYLDEEEARKHFDQFTLGWPDRLLRRGKCAS